MRSFIAGICSAAVVTAGLAVASAPAGASLGVTGTRLVSAPGGTEANGNIEEFSLSPDGTWAVFTSDASNLVPGDLNGVRDVFAVDMATGAISRVSRVPGGGEAESDSYEPMVCDGGEIVVFTTDSDFFDEDNDFNGASDVYIVKRDLDDDGTFDEFEQAGGVEIRRMSVAADGTEPDFGAYHGAISGDCSWVAYATSDALVDADTNETDDIYVRPTSAQNINRRVTGTGSADGGGGFLPALSHNGRYLVFPSFATDIVQASIGKFGVYLRDRDTDNDGAFDETNQVADEYINKAANGTVSNGGPDATTRPSMTPDGRCVAFKYFNGFELSADAQANAVYVRDRTANTTTLVSKDAAGITATEAARPSITDDCASVLFDSSDNTLDPEDSNPARDAFVKSLSTGELQLVSRGADGNAKLGVHLATAIIDPTTAIVTSTATELGGAPGFSGSLDVFRLVVGGDVIDTTPPTNVAISGVPARYTIAGTFNLGYTATDENLDEIVLQRRTGAWNGSLNAFATWKTFATPGTTPAALLPGYSYCFRATASDGAGNVSAPTPGRCVTRPLSSGSLVYSTGSKAWVKKLNTKAYAGALRTTKVLGATAIRTSVKANRIALLVTRCSTCGSVKVYWNNVLVKSVSTAGATTKYSQFIEVADFGAVPKTGTVKIVVSSSGKPLFLEGLAVLKTA
ncbi:MAG TPA: hypothetical protein VFZ83_14740 [Acidimicrobiia bacterium]|nr:hypothetical protein [Acidimicrobiia bacterium]